MAATLAATSARRWWLYGDELAGTSRHNKPSGFMQKEDRAILNLTCTFMTQEREGVAGNEKESDDEVQVLAAWLLQRSSGVMEVSLR